jgi:hypothetical protein
MRIESINVPEDLQYLIARIVTANAPYVRPHTVRRAALRVGLRMLDKQPDLLADLIREEMRLQTERRGRR